MIRLRRAIVLAATGLALGCAPPRVQPPQPRSETTVVLLPDPTTGEVGRAVVSNASGAVDLMTARAATRVAAGESPREAAVLSESDARALVDDVLATLPKAPDHFVLYFQFESDELTVASKALVQQVVAAVKSFPAPEVVVTGHTDTTGSPASNIELGLKRASVVRRLLVDAGLDDGLVQVFSHGENDLLVPTRDDVYEPRNRRVEISVR
jgi:outer membrane protein OmpA-like peptidoglycan-associated protein